jgi:hypothetical protein
MHVGEVVKVAHCVAAGVPYGRHDEASIRKHPPCIRNEKASAARRARGLGQLLSVGSPVGQDTVLDMAVPRHASVVQGLEVPVMVFSAAIHASCSVTTD